MSKHRVAVLKVVTNQSSVTAAAAEVGLSRGYLQRLLRRCREGGLEALEPRSRRPHTSPGRTPAVVRERIVALRTELTAQGLDAGPLTIAWHLEREGLRAPSTSTIRRSATSRASRNSSRSVATSRRRRMRLTSS